MIQDRWQLISQIFHDALARSENERGAFMAEACAHDESLRAEVESLLTHHTSAAGFTDMVSAVARTASVGSVTGRRLGVYEVRELLGVGGMGEVYRAHDTKLGRDVAIKVLPEEFTLLPERVARFEQEARVLASLKHPHIGAIYGLEEADNVRALVLELVEGETLAERIARAAEQKVRGSSASSVPSHTHPPGLSLSESVAIAQQIADALDAAHEKGIVHRDLNPSNISLEGARNFPPSPQTDEDINVKLLDFGLAKLSPAHDPADLNSPEKTLGKTREGMILGTAAYMSPEQARGHTVDKRTDIWAFGCVLYEMLTGLRPFIGATLSDTVAAILGNEPDWSVLPPSLPPSLRRLIGRCLEKDAKRRFRDIGDVRIELDDTLGRDKTNTEASRRATPESTSDTTHRGFTRTRLAWAATAASGVLALAAILLVISYRRPVATQYQFSLAPPPGMHFVSLEAGGPAVLSLDGETVAFVVADRMGETSIWTRRLNTVDPTRLGGTDGGAHPFWSPDGRFIGFFTPGKLQRIALAGGPPQILAEAAHGRGGSWSKGGVILFTPDYTEGLYRVSADAGNPERLTAPDFSRRETSHRWPFFLPDGRRFLFLVRSDRPDVQGLYMGSLDSKEFSRLLSIPSGAVYARAPDTGEDYLVFEQRGFLTAQSFSLATGRLVGGTSIIARLPSPPEDTSVAPASVSARGVLVYEGGTLSRQALAWVDRAGRELGVIGAEGQYRNPHLSPDRKTIAIEKLEFKTGLGSIWLFDLDRDVQHRLTTQEGAFSPVWSPDGQRLLFVSYRGNQWDLIRRNTADESDAQVLRTSTVQAATDWSKDDKWIIYQEKGSSTSDQWDIGAFEISTGKVQTLVSSEHNEHQAQLSPDSRWFAYTSNESGNDQVYLQRFPFATPRIRVSAAGGTQPKWRPDGRELFYIGPNQDMMSVTADLKSNPPALSSSRLLFRANIARPTGIFAVASYDIDSEGARFLIQAPPQIENLPQQINVIVNWMTGRASN